MKSPKTAAEWCEISAEALHGMKVEALSEGDGDRLMAVSALELVPLRTPDEAALYIVEALDHELAALRRRIAAIGGDPAYFGEQVDRTRELAAGLVRNRPGRSGTR